MANLPNIFQDDVLDVSVNTRRKYNMIQNPDGTVSFEDVTVYSQTGDNFGANEINTIRSHIGMIIQSTTLDTEAKVIAIYGGTSWSKIEGRVLVGEGTLDSTHSYTINTTGGEPEHTLTIAEMPSHSHSIANQWGSGSTDIQFVGSGKFPKTGSTNKTGGDQPHNIMQPYKVVYIWERTA